MADLTLLLSQRRETLWMRVWMFQKMILLLPSANWPCYCLAGLSEGVLPDEYVDDRVSMGELKEQSRSVCVCACPIVLSRACSGVMLMFCWFGSALVKNPSSCQKNGFSKRFVCRSLSPIVPLKHPGSWRTI